MKRRRPAQKKELAGRLAAYSATAAAALSVGISQADAATSGNITFSENYHGVADVVDLQSRVGEGGQGEEAERGEERAEHSGDKFTWATVAAGGVAVPE